MSTMMAWHWIAPSKLGCWCCIWTTTLEVIDFITVQRCAMSLSEPPIIARPFLSFLACPFSFHAMPKRKDFARIVSLPLAPLCPLPSSLYSCVLCWVGRWGRSRSLFLMRFDDCRFQRSPPARSPSASVRPCTGRRSERRCAIQLHRSRCGKQRREGGSGSGNDWIKTNKRRNCILHPHT